MKQPNKIISGILKMCCPPRRLDDVQGDFEELFYERVENKGRFLANLFFIIDALSLFPLKLSTRSNTIFALFRSYFKLAVRHAWKNKWSMSINIVGMSCAIGVCIFAYTFQAFNIEFDTFYPDTDNIYRVHAMTTENGKERRNELSPLAMDQVMREKISGIKKVSSYLHKELTVKKGTDFFSEGVAIASKDFFSMFDIPLYYGTTRDFELGEYPTAYLAQTTAQRYFGNEMPIGEQLTIYIDEEKKLDVIVAGVFDHIPLNASFIFNVLIDQDHYYKALDIRPGDWTNQAYVSHYLELDPQQINSITGIINDFIPRQNKEHDEFKLDRFELVPFRSSLISEDVLQRSNANDRLPVAATSILSALAMMVFLVACFNLANTFMALIAKRLREIGVRKTLGSGGSQILFQFLFEVSLLSVTCFIVGLLMSDTISDAFMSLFGSSSFLLRDVSLSGILLFAAAFLIFTTLMAGLVPALYAWKFQPVDIMRKSVKLKGVSLLNKGLTVAQYSISITILVTAISFSFNSDFLTHLDIGYQNKDIIHLPLTDTKQYGILKHEIDKLPGVRISGTRNHLAHFGQFSGRTTLRIDTTTHEVVLYAVGADYLNFMGVNITAGRGFIDHSENERKKSVLVNQEFADQYFDGINPVNQVVKVDGQSKTIVGITANIIDNVFKDAELKPIIFSLDDQSALPHIVVKPTHDIDMADLNKQLQMIWSEQIDQPYPGQLQKQLSVGKGASQSESVYKIFLAMAILGGLLSIIGIYSLAKLNIVRRTKEVSIRKVLGASVKDLILTVNRSFTAVLLTAFLFGSTIGYFIADLVLDMIYSYRVDVSLLTSLVSGVFIVLVSLIMITGAVMLPAKSNPVDGLSVE